MFLTFGLRTFVATDIIATITLADFMAFLVEDVQIDGESAFLRIFVACCLGSLGKILTESSRLELG